MKISRSILFAFAAAALTTTGASTAVEAQSARAAERNPVSLKVVDARGRALPLAKVSPPDRQRIERLVSTLRAYGRDDGASAIKIDVYCSYPPLKCRIDIAF